MDQVQIRQLLGEVARELGSLDTKRQILEQLHQNLEALLIVEGGNGTSQQLELPIRKSGAKKPMGLVSIRAAVKDVLQSARGAPLHTSEMWLRAQQLGAKTNSKNPQGLMDLTAYSLQENGAEKVAPRTWRWNATENTLQMNGSLKTEIIPAHP